MTEWRTFIQESVRRTQSSGNEEQNNPHTLLRHNISSFSLINTRGTWSARVHCNSTNHWCMLWLKKEDNQCAIIVPQLNVWKLSLEGTYPMWWFPLHIRPRVHKNRSVGVAILSCRSDRVWAVDIDQDEWFCWYRSEETNFSWLLWSMAQRKLCYNYALWFLFSQDHSYRAAIEIMEACFPIAKFRRKWLESMMIHKHEKMLRDGCGVLIAKTGLTINKSLLPGSSRYLDWLAWSCLELERKIVPQIRSGNHDDCTWT